MYQSNFEPNTRWTEEFAQGHEIRDYWQGVARKYDVYKYVRAQQRVERTEWFAEKGKWRVTVRDLKEDRVSFNLYWILGIGYWVCADCDCDCDCDC